MIPPERMHLMARTIRKSDPMPYYAQLAQILREDIKNDKYRPGDLLPSESELGERYDISRTAVRQALDELVNEGLVQKEKGRGTIVTHSGVATFVVQELRGFFEEMSQRGDDVTTTILQAAVGPVPPFAMTDLQLGSTDEVVIIERVRRVNDEPVVAVATYLPHARFKAVLDHDLETSSLYHILSDEIGVRLGGGRRRFEAEGATPTLADWLDVPVGEPLLKVTSVNFDEDDIPFEFFIAHYRADRVAFDVLVQPTGGRPDAVFDLKRKFGGGDPRRG